MALGDLVATLSPDPLTGEVNLSSPTATERRRALANALLREGLDASPIRSPWQGASRIANALLGTYEGIQADRTEKAGRDSASASFGALMSQPATGGATQPFPAAPAPQSALSGGGAFAPMFAQAGTRHGISPSYLTRTAEIESGMNPNAHNQSGADGLMQFMPGTAKQYGLVNPRDPAQSIEAAARLAEDNKRVMVAALGRNPTDAELYLAHQQGGKGAASLLANPNAPAASIVGERAVSQNGGKPGMTAGEFAGMWLNKFGGAPTAQPSQNTQIAQNAQIDPAKLMAIMQNPWATPAQQQVAASLLKQNQDPRDLRLKDLSIQEKEAALGDRDLTRQSKRLEIQKQERDLAGEGAIPLDPKERQAFGIPEGQPAYKTRSGEIKFGPGGTKITNDLTGGSSKQIFDTMSERAQAAQAAANGLNAIKEARKAIADGGFFGAGADARLGFAKIGQLLGFEDGRIVNTETFRSAIAPQVSAMLKATVGSTNISNSDREFAEKAVGGSIALDQRSIARLLDIMERGSTAVIDRHKSALDKIYPDQDGKFSRERALFNVEAPPPSPRYRYDANGNLIEQ